MPVDRSPNFGPLRTSGADTARQVAGPAEFDKAYAEGLTIGTAAAVALADHPDTPTSTGRDRRPATGVMDLGDGRLTRCNCQAERNVSPRRERAAVPRHIHDRGSLMTHRWVSRAGLAAATAAAMLSAAATNATAANYTSSCWSTSDHRDRCWGSYSSGSLAALAWYHDNTGERRMCASDELVDGHSGAVRFRRYGSTDAYRIVWAHDGKGSSACTSGMPGSNNQRFTMEACIGEYATRALLSCDNLVVVTL
jgi:hypothetical protein